MQVNASQSSGSLSGATPLSRQAESERTTPSQDTTKKEKALTVAISPEAQALQKQAEVRKEERMKASEKEQALLQQQAPQPKAQGSEGTAGRQRRIDLTV